MIQAIPLLRSSADSTLKLLSSGAGLIVLLLVLVRPEITQELRWPERTGFWFLHVTTGFCILYFTDRLFRRSNEQDSTIFRVFKCALVSSLLLAPVFVVLDAWWPTTATEEIDSWIDRIELQGWPGALFAEWIETTPWTLTIWSLLNLPWLATYRSRLTSSTYSDYSGFEQTPAVGDSYALPTPTSSPNNTEHRETPPAPTSLPTKVGVSIRDNIPPYFGTDIVAASSQLHDLVIHTTVGETPVAGNLRDLAKELAAEGLQIHRSHWVAAQHVTRTTYSNGKAMCIMSNGLRLPVSRRRWKAVRDYFGLGVIKHHDNANP